MAVSSLDRRPQGWLSMLELLKRLASLLLGFRRLGVKTMKAKARNGEEVRVLPLDRLRSVVAGAAAEEEGEVRVL